MPHQCLKCGHVFEEGSSQLLKGCPECNGNRFFYTKKPLDEKQREDITNKVGKDINSTIMELLDGNKDIIDNSGNWLEINPDDVKKAVKKHLKDKKIKPDKKENIEILTGDEYRKEAIEKIESEMEDSMEPETIDIEKPGKYKIDVKGLLEDEPIIIQKDGSYTIHLPSIFKMINEEK
jgi:hypothetical protein